jgi:2-polyprenyl-3-methyl-5-hydroxy-6-metoxy-1,4-benzoquinol methylase
LSFPEIEVETMTSNIFNPWDRDYEGPQPCPVYEPLWDVLRSFIRSVPVKTALDFGCGDGTYSYLMKEEGLQVTGIDISARAIEKANSRNNACDGSMIKFIRNGSIPDDIPKASLDVVVMLNSLHCLTQRERSDILARAKWVLKQDGHFFASVLSLEDESYPRQEWREIEENTFIDGAGKIFHFFSFDELADELKGFCILESGALSNIHPDIGRKSALFVVTAKIHNDLSDAI